MNASTESPVYGLFLEFAEPEVIETKARGEEAVRAIEQLDGVVAEIASEGVDVRGFYDLTGFDAFGSVLVWLRSTSVTDLQWAQRQLRRTMLLGDTVLMNARIAAELTVLDDEPGRWLNLVEAVDAPAFDADFDYGDELLDVVDEADSVDGDFVEGPEADGDALDEGEDFAPDDDAAPGSANVSLHARIGIGPLGYLVVAEADAAIGLIGELGRPFGDDLELEVHDSGTVGRLVSTAELFEVLR